MTAIASKLVELDRRLTDVGVKFLPWVGERYLSGFSNRRLLILGESHYEEWQGDAHDLSPSITRNCVNEALTNLADAAPLWGNIERALLNRSTVPRNVADDFWQCVAFYNFVQSPVRASDIEPDAEQFKSSWIAFKKVIEELRPERIIVCGSRLWKNMPPAQIFLRGDIQAYHLEDGKEVWCLSIRHPSKYFSWSQWHPLIIIFLKNPSEASQISPPGRGTSTNVT